MKKTLPFLAASVLLAPQAHAITQKYGFESGNHGTIKVSVTGDCQFEKTYNITDVGVYNDPPQYKLQRVNTADTVVISDLGNFAFFYGTTSTKDKISYTWNETQAKTSASTTEKTLLNALMHETPGDTVNYYAYLDQDGHFISESIEVHNIYKQLANDPNFDGNCKTGGNFKDRFESIVPLVNSPSFTLKSTNNYSSILNKKTLMLTTTLTMNTTFGGPLKQEQSGCITTKPLNAANYSYSCSNPAPVNITISFTVNAKEIIPAPSRLL